MRVWLSVLTDKNDIAAQYDTVIQMRKMILLSTLCLSLILSGKIL